MSTSILTLNATGDNRIVDGSASGAASLVDVNYGGNDFLLIGLDSLGVWRTLLNFPLNGLNGNVVNAFIRMVFDREFNSPISCTSVGQTTPGCPTVHTITTQWGEGSGQRDAITGESSWLHSEFPSLWNSPGGDVNSNPVGQLSPPSQYTEGTVFEFPLNVNEMQRIIDNNTPYFGFIVRDDDNTGFMRYYSRERSSGAFSPQLVLEMSATADPPTSPTRAPTAQPTVTTTLPEARFFQTLIVPLFLTSAEEIFFRRQFQGEVARFTNENVIPDDSEFLTIVDILFTGQQVNSDNSTFADTDVIYSMAIERGMGETVSPQQPVDPEQLEMFLDQFEGAMADPDLQQQFEDNLIENGVQVQPGSVSEVQQLQTVSDTNSPTEGETFTQELITQAFGNETNIDQFVELFEQEIARIGNDQVVEDYAIITIVDVIDVDQTVIDQDGQVEDANTDVSYTVLFERFLREAGTLTPVDPQNTNDFLDIFEDKLASEETRREFEERLIEAGIMVQPGSLEPPVRVVSAVQGPTSGVSMPFLMVVQFLLMAFSFRISV